MRSPKILDRAIEALNAGASTLPLEDVDNALRQAPHDFRLWHVKGLIHREQERRELAIPALRRAVELAPEEPLVAHGYARTLLEAGVPCVEQFAHALKIAPHNSDVVKGLASALVAEGRIDDAVEGLDKVLRRSPLWTDGHNLLARLRWLNGERAHFTRSFDQALEHHPKSLDLRRQQMIALMHAEQFDDVLQKALLGSSMFGKHPLFTCFEAMVRSEWGEVGAADGLFKELIPLQFATFDLFYVRHVLKSGRPGEAVQFLDNCLRSPEQALFWPYVEVAWCLTGDPRYEWLECAGQLVRVYDISDSLPPMDDLAACLRKIHVLHSRPLEQSVRGGTQTDGHLFQRIEPEIITVRESIRTIVSNYMRDLPALSHEHPTEARRPSRISFSGAWSVRLEESGRHANHVHPNGWLSSALYIALPEDVGRNDAGYLTIGEPDERLGIRMQPSRVIEPKQGRLALFPSWMWHGTVPFANGERITIAFDVAPRVS